MNNYNSEFKINDRLISIDSPTYFIADIASNHDNDLDRAIDLIHEAKKAGADAVKFQHFTADTIVSDYGFKNLDSLSHQSSWEKSVYDTYKDAECNVNWTEELVRASKRENIEFMTTPYNFDVLTVIDRYVNAYKIGSGDITWIDFIEEISKLNKPILLATGASDLEDTKRAVNSVLSYNSNICLMQCNTNYTGSLENFKYINLNVLKTFFEIYPNMILGLSDHSPYHSAVLGAIALGARIIEKHFTDDNSRVGPDHAFSMNPETWKDMIDRSRELENALGDGIKRIEENEQETVIVQRRCIRLKDNLNENDLITKDNIEFLRPAPKDSIEPYKVNEIINKKVNKFKNKGDALYFNDLMG